MSTSSTPTRTKAPVRINPGKRAVVAGRTGSGKSSMANWMLVQSPGHWIILNPKWTSAFNDLPSSQVVEGLDLKKIRKSLEENRFTIINPNPNQMAPDLLDTFIQWLHENYTDVGLCLDESYAVHTNGKAGPGLVGWLTRGRELKQSFLGLTQRPAWLSKFLFSESDYICAMSLTMAEDRKRMFEFTGREIFNRQLPPYEWLWYDVAADELRHMGPVPLTQNKKGPIK